MAFMDWDTILPISNTLRSCFVVVIFLVEIGNDIELLSVLLNDGISLSCNLPGGSFIPACCTLRGDNLVFNLETLGFCGGAGGAQGPSGGDAGPYPAACPITSP